MLPWPTNSLPPIMLIMIRRQPIRDTAPEGEKKRANLYRSAFPDLHFTVEEVIADGDKVVARYSARGTHKGELNGIAPTGKSTNVSGVTIARIANGKVAESWVNWDALGLMRQLGVVPEHAAKSKTATR